MHGFLHDPVCLLKCLPLSAVAGIALWVVSRGRRPWPQHRLCLGGLLLCACYIQPVAWFVADRSLPQRHRAVVILPGLAALLYLCVTTPGLPAYLALWLAASAVAVALQWLTSPRSDGLPVPAAPGAASLLLRPFLAAAALCTALCGGNPGRILASLVQALWT